MTPRGGYREGAGRKALPKSKRGKPAQFYLMPDTIKRIAKLARALKCAKSEVVERAIAEFLKGE